MSDALTRFIRSNSVYSKTSDRVHVAMHDGEAFVFVGGLPMRYCNFLHYAIQAVNPQVERPAGIQEVMDTETNDLLPRIGIYELNGTKYVGTRLRESLKVDGSDEQFTTSVNEMLDVINEQIELLAVRNLNDHVVAQYS